jgi:BCD family chlorophyll transporter-like MFS transporter
MLAYSAQDLILEPFAGTVFGMTPGQSTQLSGVQHAGVLLGMVALALLGTWRGSGESPEAMRGWTVAGCALSALMLAGLSGASLWGPGWPLQASVFALGVANGMFAVAAIGSMMTLAGRGAASREGLRMGLWGAAQALAFGLGGFLGTAASDLAHFVLGDAVAAYAWVFATEAAVFLVAATMALRGPQGRADPGAAAGAGAGAGAEAEAGAGAGAAYPQVPGLSAGLAAELANGRGSRTIEEKHA